MGVTTLRGRTAEKLGDTPTEVFARRLREMREARGLSQAALADRVTGFGVPIGKLALMRIENRKRGVSLDEMIALTRTLHASAAHMLSPHDGEKIALHANEAVDGAALRNWLRTGEPFLGMTPEGRSIDFVEGVLVAYARALVDASASGDKAGIQDAVLGILDAAKEAEASRAS